MFLEVCQPVVVAAQISLEHCIGGHSDVATFVNQVEASYLLLITIQQFFKVDDSESVVEELDFHFTVGGGVGGQ